MTTATGTRTTPTVAFVQSSWHADLVDGARRGFLEVASAGVAEVETFELPGAFEIPLHAKLLAETGRFDAIVAAGLVVDGGIYRHEFVAETVIRALMQVQLETDVPVFSAVLTPHHFHEHDVHQAFFGDHLLEKGAEAARACASTLISLNRIPAVA